MPRHMQLVVSCDACQKDGHTTPVDPEDQSTIDVGIGYYAVDLCETHQKALLEPLLDLLGDYGTRVGSPKRTVVQKTTKRDDDEARECPECGKILRGNRTSVISHLASLHGVDRIEASKLIPPLGPSVSCTYCGFLSQLGQGYVAHVKSAHGVDAWKAIAKDAKKS